MIDTIRLTGPAEYYNFSYTYERFTGIKKADGDVHISEIAVENKKGIHRVFFSPSLNTITVELNPAKLMFGDNVYNYETNKAILNSFVRLIGSYYFRSGSYYVARIDLGGVFTLENTESAAQTIEKFRGTRIDGARVNRFKQQNYASSVFYPSKNWSIKIYNKGIEMGVCPQDEHPFLMKEGMHTKEIVKVPNPNFVPPEFRERNRLGFDLLSTIRVEKTYRFREMERIAQNFEALKVPALLPNATMQQIQIHGIQIAKAKMRAIMQVTKYRGVHIDSFDIGLLIDDFNDVWQKWQFTATPYLTNAKGTSGLLSVIEATGHLSDIEGLGIVSRSTFNRYRQKKRAAAEFVPQLEFKNNSTQKVSNIWGYCRNFGLSQFIGNSAK